MATPKNKTGVVLPAEHVQRLRDLEKTLTEAKEGIKVMKRMDMDVSKIEEQLEWAEKVKAELLANFT